MDHSEAKQKQSSNRLARQNQIDDALVSPIWGKMIDIPIIELAFAREMPKSPVILMPELRFKSFLTRMTESLTGTGKIMIVDNTNARFEALRACVQKSRLNLYFSSQEISALNYADNIFDFVLTEFGLTTAVRAEAVFDVYQRVLKPGGHLICAAPLWGSFSAFFDIFEECIYKNAPKYHAEIIENLRKSMDSLAYKEALLATDFKVDSCENVEFELEFPSAEQLLFASLIETHYLSYALSLVYAEFDSRTLLAQIVAAFHHYFQGESIKMPLKMVLLTAHK